MIYVVPNRLGGGAWLLGYFGKGGEELGEAGRGRCRISFSGAVGLVAVTVYENAKEREVEDVTREFEYHSRRLLTDP